jgi:hypothetical protein
MSLNLDDPVVYDDYDDDPRNDDVQPEVEEKPDWYELFDAPGYASWLKVEETAVSREYRKKSNSFLKMVMVGCINTGNFPDAAAIIDRGPAFSQAVGQLAASNPNLGKAIDLVMSPSSPAAQFIAAGLPLVAQLWRNHEEQFSEIPAKMKMTRAQRKAARESGEAQPKSKPLFTVKLGKRVSIPVRLNVKMRVRFLLGGFRAQSQNPNILTHRVFTDQKVINQLTKMGVVIRKAEPDD